MQKQVGYIKQEVLNVCQSDKLTLKLNQPIYISDGNEDHIKNDHPIEYEKYFSELNNILENPDYMGIHPNGRSLEYFKFFEEGNEKILVAIRATQRGTLFVRSLYYVTDEKFQSYLDSNTIHKNEKK